ncbi:sugar ABC transporter ATP-binding protein [Dictyobacter aurantiacus]|uniref:Sugar ABC transporter ATP-binding protein n=1 Tax=Dictyobacter aurantiacus TaxID=1936993 RepID=A0A401ZQP7_9CHLR|nr:sugar ABC transporter ATP-binding protein [Dictyobacter aurantiacus]GCE09238.1 sugar ABC transporter ATP-binding protein [Dictyobacter aurantiacus]
MNQAVPLLTIEHVRKTFPGVVALTDAHLQVFPGEVHALVGQNGAGKSTLIKILSGAYTRESGSITFEGQPVNFHTPQQAQNAGISTIYQEINLVPLRTVAENIYMGKEPRRWGFINWRAMNEGARTLLERLHISIDVTRPLLSYNIALQQMVAIARALSFESRLVIMDEPTSSLNEHEVETLFDSIRQLQSEGVSTLFVGHRLDEIYTICDRVTIMRDGRTVDVRDLHSLPRVELVSRMLGKEQSDLRQHGQTSFTPEQHHAQAKVVLEAHDLRRSVVLHGASVRVHAGEIVGLGGLLGSGRSEVVRAIFAADPIEGGTISVEGEQTHFRTPIDAIRAGIGFCSEDRKADGIIPFLSVRENMTLAVLPRISRYGIVSRQKQQEIVDTFIRRLDIKTSGPDQPIRELSGGNQQKVLLARWLCLDPTLLLLDEPTRGIDIGAKAEIQGLIEELAEKGVSMLMISSELEELIEGCDRIVILRDGKSVASFARNEVTQDALMAAMAHGEGEPKPPVSDLKTEAPRGED